MQVDHNPNSRASFRAGVVDMLQTAPAILLWALVTGVTMAKSTLTLAPCLGMSLLVYGGSAQLASLPLIASQAPLAVICVAALVINLRFLIFSAAMRPQFMHLPTRQRAFYGYWVADITFVLFMNRAQSTTPLKHTESYLLGLGLCNWLCWQSGAIVGIVAASFVPTSWGLDLAGTLALLALMVPQCATQPGVAGVIVAAVVGVLAYPLPLRLGILLAALAGIATSVWVESRQAKRP
jgi:predicted branched-subunit amino acid permease